MTHKHRGRTYTEHSTLLSSPSPSQLRYALNRRKTTLRQDIWTVLRFRSSMQHRSGLQFASYVLELSVLTLILLNVVVGISESSAVVDAEAARSASGASSPPLVNDWTDIFLLVSTIIFSIEYALRLWSCVEDDRYNKGAIKGRYSSGLVGLKWMTRPLSLIDLMALIPFYVELAIEFEYVAFCGSAHHGKGLTLRSLRLLRVVSFVRLERMYNAMKNLRVIFARKKEEFLVVTYLTALVVLTSSLMIFFLEHVTQPNVFASFSVCMWWSVETITSLGYGDVVPVTGMGRVVGASLALWGIVLFTIPGAVLGSGFIEVMLEKQHEKHTELYSLAASARESLRDSAVFVGNFSDDEPCQVHPRDYEKRSPVAARTAESVTSCESRSSSHVAAAIALHHKLDTITAAQHHLDAHLRQQEQQLERLTRLVEAALPNNLHLSRPEAHERRTGALSPN
ncbi:hypothetical protein PsorP6_018067 [Peronosclerospora sorghi]|uniref:Uncharacterized protein n=1 Tax=Peronosclerospora sorghi TaxID=230839 RepID=A0ACC0WE34_9STRA|nr:hypothetical protein PsorP6_018067 [Peronosclerospora sorghi]